MVLTLGFLRSLCKRKQPESQSPAWPEQNHTQRPARGCISGCTGWKSHPRNWRPSRKWHHPLFSLLSLAPPTHSLGRCSLANSSLSLQISCPPLGPHAPSQPGSRVSLLGTPGRAEHSAHALVIKKMNSFSATIIYRFLSLPHMMVYPGNQETQS